MAFYAHDDLNNRIETLSKEEIYALLAAAIQQGQLPQIDQNTAFVTMIKSIVDGKAYKQAFCTQAQYNELLAAGTLEADTMYYITDDESYNDLVNIIQTLQSQVGNNTTDIDNLKGQHLYEHSLTILFAEENSYSALIFIRILSSKSETLTVNDIKSLITDLRYSCTGSVRYVNDAYAVNNIKYDTSNSYYIVQYSHTYTDTEKHFSNDFTIVNAYTPRQLF